MIDTLGPTGEEGLFSSSLLGISLFSEKGRDLGEEVRGGSGGRLAFTWLDLRSPAHRW